MATVYETTGIGREINPRKSKNLQGTTGTRDQDHLLREASALKHATTASSVIFLSF